MASIRLKVGPKGQIIIPKALREVYGIKEGEEIVLEPTDKGLFIKRKKAPDELVEELLEWKRKVEGVPGKLGDLRGIDLEDEFDENIS